MSGNSFNYRLKPDMLARPEIRGLSRSALNKWYEKEFPGTKTIAPVTLTTLKNGGVVNHHAMQIVARYLNRHSVQGCSGGRSLKLTDFDSGPYSIPVIADPTLERTSSVYRVIDYWKLSWPGLLDSIKSWNNYRIDERHSVPSDKEDVRRMAELVTRSVGRRCLKSDCDDASAEFAGQQFLGLDKAPLAEWFETIWAVQPRTLMYSVAYTNGGRPTRCGITVVIPLKYKAFTAFCAGKLDTFSSGHEHVCYPSHNLFIFSVADIPHEIEHRTAKNAQLVTGLYQIAMLCPWILSKTRMLRVACVKAFPDNVEKSRTFGFLPTGTRTAGLGHPLAVLANPHDKEWAKYHLARPTRAVERAYGYFLGTLIICQTFWCRSYTAALKAAKRQ